jgi:hypothetical protein
LFLFSLADVWALPARPRHPSSSSSRNARRRPSPRSNALPSSIPFTPCPFRRPGHTYKYPCHPLLFPPLSPLYYAARPTKSIAGVRHSCRRVFFDTAVTVS